MIALKRYLI